MNGITTEQIEFLRNQLPDIVKRFNEKNKCNTKLFEWTRLYFKDGSLQPDRLLTIESLIDPSVDRLEFAQGLIYDNKLLYWKPVFIGDVLYYNNTKVTIASQSYNDVLSDSSSYSKIACHYKLTDNDKLALVRCSTRIAVHRLSFYPKSDVLTYNMTNLDGERETLELPRPIKNTDALVGSGNYWYTTILGMKYYFLTAEDRDKFIKVIQKSLKYSEVDYDI